MDESILILDHVSVRYHNAGNETAAVNNVSAALGLGSRLGIIGESGSGKTTLAHAIMGLLDGKADVTGSIRYRGIELTAMPEAERHIIPLEEDRDRLPERSEHAQSRSKGQNHRLPNALSSV